MIIIVPALYNVLSFPAISSRIAGGGGGVGLLVLGGRRKGG